MEEKQVCCVKNCPAKGRKDVTFFGFPLNKERRLQWLKLIGRMDLRDDQKSLNTCEVCSIHFDKSKIMVMKQTRHHAVPTRNIPRKRRGVPIFSSNTASQTDFSSDEDQHDYDGENCEKVVIYKRITPNRKMFVCCEIDCDDNYFYDDDVNEKPTFTLQYSEHEPKDSIALGNRKIFAFSEGENAEPLTGESASDICQKQTEDIQIPGKETSTSDAPNNNGGKTICVLTDIVSLNEHNSAFREFFEWRHRTTDRRKGAKYDKDFRIFALNLHTINTRAYRLLMDSWQLPKETELKDTPLDIGPRLDEQMMRLLQQKFKLLTEKEKFCTLGIYAMPLKPHLYYDPAKDDIIGTHNVNGSKKRMASTHALIAMIRGVIVPWHQPIAYSFFSTMSDVDDIELFLRDIFEKLKIMGLNILGVVLSPDLYFWKYCRAKHIISATKTFLLIGSEKLYVVFDIPHVFNMLKDEFMSCDYVLEHKKVSGKYVKEVYNIDKENGNRLLPELTDEHLNVGNKEINPEHSCQLFSKKVCGALNFYKDFGLIDAESVPTANFIQKVADIFDLLMNNQIRNNKSKDWKIKLAAAQNKAFDNGFCLFKKLLKVNTDFVSAKSEVDSLKYLMISFKSLLFMSGVLKNAQQIGIMQTRFCDLEPMKELVKSIKEDTKTSKPSSIKFMGCFSKLFLKNLVDLTPAPSSIGNMDDFLKMADDIKDCFEMHSGNRIRLNDYDYRFTLPEVYPIIYVSSYLLYKCSQFHSCQKFTDFMNRMVDLNKTKVYVNFEKYNKEATFYDKLKLPPIELPAYVERLDNYFVRCFKNVYYLANPAETIYIYLKDVARWNSPCPCFPDEYLLKLFVRTRIYETVLHNTKNLKKVSANAQYFLEAKNL